MNTTEVFERFRADQYATAVTGIEIIDVREDYAKTKLVVGPQHLNALGMMQGGALFTLADFTFAVATNAGYEESTVAIECTISFLKPVTDGVLYAESEEVFKTRSLKALDVTITDGRGEIVAKFHGRGFVRHSSK